MSFKGMPMHQIKEILRLSRAVKLGVREIARSLRVSPATVSKYLEEVRERFLASSGRLDRADASTGPISKGVRNGGSVPKERRGLGSNSFGPEEAEGSDAPALVGGVP